MESRSSVTLVELVGDIQEDASEISEHAERDRIMEGDGSGSGNPTNDAESGDCIDRSTKEAPLFHGLRPLAAQVVLDDEKSSIMDVCFGLAVVGVFCMVATNEVYWKSGYFYNSWAVTILKIVTTLTTVALIITLYAWYKAKLAWMKARHLYPMRTSLWSSQLVWTFLLEAFVLAIHIPAFVETTVTVESERPLYDAQAKFLEYPVDAFGCIMFIRFYLIFRVLRYHSPAYGHDARIMSAFVSRAMQSDGGRIAQVNLNAWFTVKILLQKKPFRTLLVAFVGLILCISYSLRMCERPMHASDADFHTSIWIVVVTMTTVGYGDVVPESYCGRGVAIVAMMFGMSFTAVIIGTLVRHMQLSTQEQRLYNFIRHKEMKRDVEERAARSIVALIRHHSYRKRHAPGTKAIIHSAAVLAFHLRAFRNARTTIDSFQRFAWDQELTVSSNELIRHLANDRRAGIQSLERRLDSLEDTMTNMIRALQEPVRPVAS